MVARVAVLGCGYWGANHIRTLKSLGALYGVADGLDARAEGFSVEHDCRHLTVDELTTNREIDAVIVALPPQFHAEVAIKLATAGKDVLIEKPIALTVSDAERGKI